MARVVADTNVLVSAVVAQGPPRQLVHLFAVGADTLVTSPALVAELLDVLRRPKFNLGDAEVEEIVATLVEMAEVVQTASRVQAVASDPDDNEVLATAIDGQAEFIVSGDPHLLALREYRGVPILAPAEYLFRRP